MKDLLFFLALLLSLWTVSVLFYQGAVLFWNGRRSSHPALLAGLSLMSAALFFVMHTLGLVWFHSGQLQKILFWLPRTLYLAALLSLLFLINIAVSERNRFGEPAASKSTWIFVSLTAIAYLAFIAVDLLFPEHSLERSLKQGQINTGLFLLGLACALPVISAILLLHLRVGGGDSAGRRLLKIGAYSLTFLVLITVSAWFTDWSGASRILGMDILAQLTILVAVIAVSQASIRYEVFSGHMPRLGMLRYFRKNVLILLLASLLCIGVLSFYDGIVWALVVVGGLGFQSGYLEYRMMKDRERLMARMQAGTEDLYQRLLQEEKDPADSVLKHLCTELGLNGARIVAGGTYASILGNNAVRFVEYAESGAGQKLQRIALGRKIPQGELHLFGTGLTREETEFARSTGERLLDAMALFQFSRILIDLQRDYLKSRKLTETMARRVLHDEILPEIHSLILERNSGDELIQRLTSLHRTIAGLLKEMPGYDNTLLKKGLLEGIRQTLGSKGYARGEIQVLSEPDLEAPEKETVFYAVREILHNALVHSDSGIRISELAGPHRLNWLIEPLNWKDSTSPGNDAPTGPADNDEPPDKRPTKSEGSPVVDKSGEQVSGSGQGLVIHSALLMLCGGGLDLLQQWPEFRIRIFLS